MSAQQDYFLRTIQMLVNALYLSVELECHEEMQEAVKQGNEVLEAFEYTEES